ncbi:MAG: hypothetical protein ACTTIU_09690, partial [Treponema lecithinolyticum]|uniref:hypothetical protein n=1 Tax=Treponema lecithinolyticum TaxID=53418 RepID=UPI003FA284BD
MADELEKKPKFRVNKQRSENAVAADNVSPEKKKVVVVKKKVVSVKTDTTPAPSVKVSVKAVPVAHSAPPAQGASPVKPAATRAAGDSSVVKK